MRLFIRGSYADASDRAVFPVAVNKNLSSSYRGGYLRFIYQYMIQLPIYKINLTNREQNKIHEKIIKLVEQMLNLNQRLSKTKGENERTIIQRQIDATDKQIDQLVYELYGLTKEEIKIVEESVN